MILRLRALQQAIDGGLNRVAVACLIPRAGFALLIPLVYSRQHFRERGAVVGSLHAFQIGGIAGAIQVLFVAYVVGEFVKNFLTADRHDEVRPRFGAGRPPIARAWPLVRFGLAGITGTQKT